MKLIVAVCIILTASIAFAGVSVEFSVTSGTVDNWQVRWGDTSTNMPNTYDLGAVTAVEDLDTVLGLVPGSKYYLQFLPQSGGSDGLPTDIYGVTVPSEPQVVEVPTDDRPQVIINVY